VHLESGQPESAEQCFRRLLAVNVEELPARGVAYDERIFGEFSLESLGLSLFRHARYAEAAQVYAQAERLDPERLAYRAKRVLAEARAGGSVT
jgi:tetratricopeptide (TPR) repeat protein